MKSRQWERRSKNPSTRTGDVPVTVQRSDDDGTVSELFAVLVGGREETLEQSRSRVKHSGILTANFYADVNLFGVGELGGNLGDLSVAAAGEVGVTEERSQRVRLELNGRVRVRQRSKNMR